MKTQITPLPQFAILTSKETNAMTSNTEPRSLRVIAREILADWKKVNYAAAPYLDAMATLDSVSSYYGYDHGTGIVRYFLINAGSWRGDTARRVKLELRGMVK